MCGSSLKLEGSYLGTIPRRSSTNVVLEFRANTPLSLAFFLFDGNALLKLFLKFRLLLELPHVHLHRFDTQNQFENKQGNLMILQIIARAEGSSTGMNLQSSCPDQ